MAEPQPSVTDAVSPKNSISSVTLHKIKTLERPCVAHFFVAIYVKAACQLCVATERTYLAASHSLEFCYGNPKGQKHRPIIIKVCMEYIHKIDPNKLPIEVREFLDVSDKVDKLKFTHEQLQRIVADFQGSITIVPTGEIPEEILAQALEVNLGVSVEGYESDLVDKTKQVDEDF